LSPLGRDRGESRSAQQSGTRATRKVVVAINAAWNIANFRAGLIRGLQADGWEVVAMAPRDAHVPRVEALGCRFVEVPMQGSGTNPWQDLKLYRRFKAALATERPAAFLGFTIKPNVYGSLAAQSLGIPVVNNIAGLGTVFVRRNWLTTVAHVLYRLALRRSHCVLFQNEEDRSLFVEAGLVKHAHTQRVPGSGVDLAAFAPVPLPAFGPARPMRFLFIGRLLREKGVPELAIAARELRARGANIEVQLLGFLDVDNPSAISRAEIEAWQAEGVLEYLGSTDDVSTARCVRWWSRPGGVNCHSPRFSRNWACPSPVSHSRCWFTIAAGACVMSTSVSTVAKPLMRSACSVRNCGVDGCPIGREW